MKLKKTLILLTSTLSLTGCNNTTKEGDPSMKEILSDTAFETGFDLLTTSTTNGRKVATYLNYNGEAKKQDETPHPWQMSQWWTPYDFSNSTFTKVSDGVYDYKNESRHVLINNKEKELTLELDSNAEYQKLFGHSRNGDENWSHLLIEQNIKNAPHIEELEHIYINLDFVINKCENLDANQKVPAAQLLWYFTITNPTNGDTAYESEVNGKRNQFMWFGIPLFDSRYKFVPEYTHTDTGFVGATNTIIYSISSSNYLHDEITFGDSYHIKLDILPFILDAYNYGKDNGALDDVALSDLVLNYMNFGWELPGSFSASATIKNLSTIIVKKGESSNEKN